MEAERVEPAMDDCAPEARLAPVTSDKRPSADPVAVIASSMASVEDELLTEVLVEKTKAQRPVVEEVEGAGDALDVGAKAKADADAEAHELAEKVALREKKLESIEYQNELIEDEAIEFEEDKKRQEALEAAEDALVAQAHEQQEAELAEADELKDLATVTAAEVPREDEPTTWRIDEERLKEAGLGPDGEDISTEQLAEKHEGLGTDTGTVAGVQIEEIEALEALARKSAVEPERIKLEHLKHAKQQLDVAALLAAGRIRHSSEAMSNSKRRKKSPSERISMLLESMLLKIETDIEQMDQKVGDRLHVLDTDDDGQISVDELNTAVRQLLRTRVTEEEVRFLVSELDEDGDGTVSVEQLSQLLQRYRDQAGVPAAEAQQTQ